MYACTHMVYVHMFCVYSGVCYGLYEGINIYKPDMDGLCILSWSPSLYIYIFFFFLEAYSVRGAH